MQLTLYKNNTPPPHMGRSLTAVSVLDVPDTVIEKMDLLNPILTVKNDAFVGISAANYCHLGAPFNRYYFMGTATAGEDGLTRIPCHVDVLYTYRSYILNADCIAERSSSSYSDYLQDEYIKVEQGYDYNVSKFNYSFDPSLGDYILHASGR
jgi:hypothetical protein